MWRGVSSMFVGCIPAHAGYCSVYELSKQVLGVNEPGHHPLGAAVAGALATCVGERHALQPLGLADFCAQSALSLGSSPGASAAPTSRTLRTPFATARCTTWSCRPWIFANSGCSWDTTAAS